MTIGRAAWAVPPFDPNNAPTLVNSFGVGNISGLSDFSTATGIKLVQVTSTSPVSIGRTYVAQVDVETIAMAAGSTMTASARVAHPLASAITGGATVVAVHS